MKTTVFTRLFVVFVSLAALLFLNGCESPEEKAASYVSNGNKLLDEGKLGKARLEFRNALQLNKQLVPAWYGLARIAEEKREWKKAYALYNKVASLDNNHLQAQLMLGKLNVAGNLIEKALKNSETALKLAPDDPEAHALSASVKYQQGDIEGAIKEATTALKSDPGNITALVQMANTRIADKDPAGALKYIDIAIQHHPDTIDLYQLKIATHLKEKQFDQAIASYHELIARFPDRDDFKKALADVYAETGALDKAEETLRARITSKPDNVTAIIDLAIFLRKHRGNDQAEAELRKHIGENTDPELSFALAELLIVNKKTAAAKAVYRQLIERHGGSPDGLKARNKLAMLELAGGNPEEAGKLVDEVLSIDPNNYRGLLTKARLQLRDDQQDLAIASLRTALKNNPNAVDALLLLARTHLAAGRWALAKTYYVRAIQAKPEDARTALEYARLLLQKNKLDEVEQVLQPVLERHPANPNLLTAMLLADIGQKRWESASTRLGRLHALIGDSPEYNRLAGIVFQGRQQYADSIDAFKKAYEAVPSDQKALVGLLQAYVLAGQKDKAEQLLKSRIADNPGEILPYILLGRLYQLDDRMAEAEQAFEKAIDTAPDRKEGYRNLADALRSQGRIADAIEMLEKAVREYPDSVPIRELLAEMYSRDENADRAIELYRGLLKDEPDNDIVANNLASLLSDTRGDRESLEQAEAIARRFRDSKVAFFLDTLGWIEHKLGKSGDAVTLLRSAIQARPDVAVFHYHLGMAYQAEKQPRRARHELEQALQLAKSPFPGMDEAKRLLEVPAATLDAANDARQ